MAIEDQVPVTGAFLSLVRALQGARANYIGESMLAESLGLPPPKDYYTRCEELFSRTYAPQLAAIGLSNNRITFQSMMDLTIDAELLRTEADELPRRFAFDPWLGQGRGGIVRLGPVAERAPAVAAAGEKFFLTRFVVDVYSQGEPVAGDTDLETIGALIDGECVGQVRCTELRQVSAQEAAAGLVELHADPAFFGLAPDGSPLDSDAERGERGG